MSRLPAHIESLLLVWTQPYAVECMSITTAMAAGYQPGFCEPGCGRTTISPLFDMKDWMPTSKKWLPAMLLPSQDEALAKAVIAHGVESDNTQPTGTVYLVQTQDTVRNVRARNYVDAFSRVANRVYIHELTTPISGPLPDAIAYFTGAERVVELRQITFLPGAAADHLTSFGGVMIHSPQMSAIDWLRQGATGSYGTVTEPCNRIAKFPIPAIFLDHYLAGESLLEAYWKSVIMPGQGLFIGEPLARPYGHRLMEIVR